MNNKEEKVLQYMSCLTDYGFDLAPATAYKAATRVVESDANWTEIWKTTNEIDRDIDEKPIGFIITTETPEMYGLVAVYLEPEYRGQLRAINAIQKMVRASDPDKKWIYQVREDNKEIRDFLTQAMIVSGYQAAVPTQKRVIEGDVPYAVYMWERRKVEPHAEIKKKSHEELQNTVDEMFAALKAERSPHVKGEVQAEPMPAEPEISEEAPVEEAAVAEVVLDDADAETVSAVKEYLEETGNVEEEEDLQFDTSAFEVEAAKQEDVDDFDMLAMNITPKKPEPKKVDAFAAGLYGDEEEEAQEIADKKVDEAFAGLASVDEEFAWVDEQVNETIEKQEKIEKIRSEFAENWKQFIDEYSKNLNFADAATPE